MAMLFSCWTMHKRTQKRRNWNGTGERAIPRSIPPTECDRLDSSHGSGCHSDPQEDVPEICTKCHIKDTMDVMAPPGVKSKPKRSMATSTTSWCNKRSLRPPVKKVEVAKLMENNHLGHWIGSKVFYKSLGISKKRALNLCQAEKDGNVVPPCRQGINKSIMKQSRRAIIREHINSFPSVPSHYCRVNSTCEYLASD